MYETMEFLLASLLGRWSPFCRSPISATGQFTKMTNQDLDIAPPPSIQHSIKESQLPDNLLLEAFPAGLSTSLAAQVLVRGKTPARFVRQSIPKLTSGQLLVRLSHSGVCATDYATYSGILGESDGVTGFVTPHVGGHEGVGTIIALCRAEKTENSPSDTHGTVPDDFQIGQRVGIRWMSQTCQNCTYCLLGRGDLCAFQRATSVHEHGTFQQFCVVHISCAVRIPVTVSAESAAAMMCAGSVAHTAVKQLAVLIPNKKATIAIIGAGGSIGHIAIQFAILLGFEVIAIDRGLEKRDLCIHQGASHFFDVASIPHNEIIALIRNMSRREGHAGVEGVIVAAGGSIEPFNMGIEILRPLGVLMLLGNSSPEVYLNVNVPMALIKNIKIVSTLMSGTRECEEALNHLANGKIHPKLAMRSFFDLDQVMRDIKGGRTIGKVVLPIPQCDIDL